MQPGGVSCPSGFVYNPSTGKCETPPSTVRHNCPRWRKVTDYRCKRYLIGKCAVHYDRSKGYIGSLLSYGVKNPPCRLIEVRRGVRRRRYIPDTCKLIRQTGSSCIYSMRQVRSHRYVRIKLAVNLITCPSGSTYNPLTGKCEISPAIVTKYTCPLDGKRYDTESECNFSCRIHESSD